MNDTVKQSNFQSQQNFKIDIDKIYSDFVKEIDKIRSYVYVGSVTKDIYNGLKTKGKSTTANKIKSKDSYQESRCHAFYRLLGLPVVDKSFQFYNPGHDIIKNPGIARKITIDTKINIASNLIPGFELISLARENLPLDNQNIFSNNQSIDAAARALSVLSFSSGNETVGGINLRPFVTPLDDSDDPFAMTSKGYKLGHDVFVGKNSVSFSDLRDASEAEPSGKVFGSKHIIRPFMVDPRIDFTAATRVCVPFVPDKSYMKVAADNYAQTPIIEKIINERLSTLPADSAGTAYDELVTFIKQNNVIKDEDIVNNILTDSDKYQITEKQKFLQFLKISQAMIESLKRSIATIHTAQNLYYWLPIPSTIGPENKCSIRKNIASEDFSAALITEADYDIIVRSAKSLREQLSIEAAKASGTPTSGNFVFGGNAAFNPTASRGFVDNNATSLQKLIKKRNEALDTANQSLRTIEIIMGEFSGLGLCDIIAVTYALYIMPEKDLLGLLDDDAYDRMTYISRMTSSFNLNKAALERSSIVDSMLSLNKTVKSLYDLMDKMYLNSLTNHSAQI